MRAGHYISDSTLSGNDQFAIYFDSPIETSATLLLQFNYTLQHKHTGYFLTPYTAGDGTKTFLGATHMQVFTEHPLLSAPADKFPLTSPCTAAGFAKRRFWSTALCVPL